MKQDNQTKKIDLKFSQNEKKILIPLTVILLVAFLALIIKLALNASLFNPDPETASPNNIKDITWLKFAPTENNVSFAYPDTMEVTSGVSPNNWSLTQNNSPFIDISITDTGIEFARQQNALQFNFEPLAESDLTGWVGKKDSVNSNPSNKLYILERPNGKNIWILLHYANYPGTAEELDKISDEIIKSLTVL